MAEQPLEVREGVRPRCPRCGYDLTGIVGVVCPECGAAFDPERAYLGPVRGALREWKEPAEATPARKVLGAITTLLVLFPLVALTAFAVVAAWAGVRVLLLDVVSARAAGMIAALPLLLAALGLAWAVFALYRALRRR